MDSEVRINNVEVYVNGEKQTQASLDRCADKEGVGNGGCLLSIAMVEFVRSVAYGESVPELTVRNVLEDLDKLIDLAAGAAIRDLSVRAATLKGSY